MMIILRFYAIFYSSNMNFWLLKHYETMIGYSYHDNIYKKHQNSLIGAAPFLTRLFLTNE